MKDDPEAQAPRLPADSSKPDKTARRFAVRLFLAALISGFLFNYGGIRSPDSAVVFLTAESLAHRGSFALEKESTYAGFGYASGLDGRKYAYFGPAESIAWVPFVWLADGLGRVINLVELGKRASPSLFFSNGINQFWSHVPKQDPEGDARRLIASQLNVVVFAATVAMFFFLIRRLTGDDRAAVLTAVMLGWCTLAFPYSGDAFSEPLATLCIVCALFHIAGIPAQGSGELWSAFWSGLFIGIGVATHLTAALFVPFLGLLVLLIARRLPPAIFFGAGIAIPLALMAWHNAARFGSTWETGRGLLSEVDLARQATVAPWRGMWELLFGSGCGLFLYSPIVCLGLVTWRSWKKYAPLWFWVFLAAMLFRFVFIASRREWHGGLGLGPRYLFMALPVLLIPAGYWLREQLSAGRCSLVMRAGVLAALAAAQQLYFALGEVFSLLLVFAESARRAHLNPFVNDRLYSNWSASPLLRLHRGLRGPWLLKNIPLTNVGLWLCCSVIAIALIVYVFHRVSAMERRSPTPD